MSHILEKEAKMLVDAGSIKRALVVNADLESGYQILLFKKADKSNQISNFDYQIARQRGGTRVFKTLDAAAACIASLGIVGFDVSVRAPS
ncbi:MAG: plasmid replication protein RepB [Streptococcus pyogenes]|nr:MAG: plasmid replication protein RepB [Streptococcus pyogenes]